MATLPCQRKLVALLVLQCVARSAFADDDGNAKSAMETVLIEAQRTPNAVARAAQQEAGNLINLVTVEEMRKLPDVNIAESVRRVPGISLETDTGEVCSTAPSTRRVGCRTPFAPRASCVP